MQEAQNKEFVGFHKFVNEDGEPYGSFEVWPSPDGRDEYYWWACYPGCLPDNDEPSGPFPTAEGAYLDATGE